MAAIRPIVMAGVLCSPLLPTAARAEEVVFSPGVHLTLTFGERAMFGVGLDARVTYITTDIPSCGPRPAASGGGVFGQATWLIGHGGRFALGAHGGGEYNEDGGALDVELGWTYGIIDGAWSAHGIQLGLMLSAYPFDLIARGTMSFAADAKVLEGHFGVGGHFPGVFGEDGSNCQIGRPLRVGGDVRLGPLVVLGPARQRAARVAQETRSALGRSWLEAARAEAASVPAFLGLARDLTTVGAPRALVARAVSAARDEVRHARLCRDLASPELGREVRPIAPPLPPSENERRTVMLERLAIESWHDGCLGEGTAARRAQLALKGVRDARAGAALAGIARDEAAHAELAWAVLEHALVAGGSPARDAFAEVLADEPEMRVAPDEESRGAEHSDRSTWAAYGRLDARQIVSARSEVVTAARHRAQRLLSQLS